MFDRFNLGILREEAGEAEGGGGAAVATETAEQKELRTLREENAGLKKQNTELSESERAWSERALRGTREPAEPKPKAEKADEEDIETGEKFLDDVSKEGLKALRKRGFVTMAEVQKLIDQTVDRTVGETRTESQFQSTMKDEFPEMSADLARVEAGKKPESELFVLAAEIYRDAIALDPDLKGSKSALLISTRQAAAQLALQGKRKTDDKAEKDKTRRDRIEAQKPGDRSSKGEEEEETGLTSSQKKMAAELGVSEEKFLAQQKKLRGQRGK